MVTLTFIIYLILMLGIGIVAYRRTQDLSDYVLGGRNLGPIPSALSAGASDMSGWLLMGLPGYAMAAGYGSFWLAGGLLVGTWLNWLLVAQRLRVYSFKAENALTLPAFFEKRLKITATVCVLYLRFSFWCSSCSTPVLVWLRAVSCSKLYLASTTPWRC